MAWFKIDDGFESHPKVKALPRGAARLRAIGLWTLAGNWSARNLTDGSIPAHMLAEFGATKADATHLVTAGLWHAHGHDCDGCTQPDLGGYQFHDWSDYQPTREQKDALREAKRRAGAQGGVASGQSRREAKTKQSALRLLTKQTNTRPVPVPQEIANAISSGVEATPEASHRPDVERVCEHLAASVEGRGVKRPTVTKAWLKSARLLIDQDGYSPDQITWLIDRTAVDPFWSSNVLSMPKLREKADQLKLKFGGVRQAPRQPGAVEWT